MIDIMALFKEYEEKARQCGVTDAKVVVRVGVKGVLVKSRGHYPCGRMYLKIVRIQR